ncbi:hypothetical protein [Streptomyces sp. S.PNR 29]|uniref:hypothetical protein n=1 Tax=Streptomyces sp. S.PNR 29 TaxID=2973805 RepID=UPI0025AF5BBA|nr:hypothetical protein [Streptomyces sp. S.PNR 29]MDN0194115.1 hypothetical protein [Streptomyces sp. S.PNR 29]
MLGEALTELAAALGAAVVQAAGTDGWAALRVRVARLFGRGDGQRERIELERLDRTAAALEAAGPAEDERVRTQEGASWQTRVEVLLEGLGEEERGQVAAEVRRVVDEQGGRAQHGGGSVSGNTFRGPTAVQVGNGNRQDNHFGSGA